MLHIATKFLTNVLRAAPQRQWLKVGEGAVAAALAGNRFPMASARRLRHDPAECDEDDFNQDYIDYFLRDDIDGWEVRQAMNNICGMDMIIDPSVVDAGLRACRTINDIAVAIRWLEAVKEKCGPHLKEYYPLILNRITPTLVELGIPTPEELNWDKPELACKSVYDM